MKGYFIYQRFINETMGIELISPNMAIGEEHRDQCTGSYVNMYPIFNTYIGW